MDVLASQVRMNFAPPLNALDPLAGRLIVAEEAVLRVHLAPAGCSVLPSQAPPLSVYVTVPNMKTSFCSALRL
jgi:hypothetical protein